MVATNLAVWFGEVVKETLRELRHKDEQPLVNATGHDVTAGRCCKTVVNHKSENATCISINRL